MHSANRRVMHQSDMGGRTLKCTLGDEELWSGLDRNDSGIVEHIQQCDDCRRRALAIRAGLRTLTDSSTPPTVPLPERIGGYRILRRLGQGGMGIVYEGEQTSPRRRVAVKVVRGGAYVDEYRVRLFRREAQTLARLKHPGIASIYEAGRTEDGQHFFAMELVQGKSLIEHVRAVHATLREKLELFRKICDSVNYAHQRGVIHRDLKPSNIIVDGSGMPKVLDFGLARIIDPEVDGTVTLTEIGRVMGTLPYMSPEEARGELDDIDVRSDVYSLGVVFYELLTDQLPYAVSKAALHEAVRVICEDHPRRPGLINRAVRGDLETISLKALLKERGRRYQSAAAFSEDIRRCLSNEPILARPTSLWYEARKFVVRQKLACAVVLIVLSTISAAWIWVGQAEIQLRESTELSERMVDLRWAKIMLDAASDRHAAGDLERAKGLYRDALQIFRRQNRNEARYGGQAMLGLGRLLVGQEQFDEMESREARRLLSDAVEIFKMSQPQWVDHLSQARTALEALNKKLTPSVVETSVDSARPLP